MIKKTKKKTNTVYEADGLYFKSKPLRDYFLELKEYKKNKLINDFSVPTIDDKIEKNKLKAVKCTINGKTFDSLMESRFYLLLLTLLKNNKIKDFETQKVFTLQESFKKNNKTYRKITYIADFVVTHNNGCVEVYDVKGKKTDVFSLKEKLFNFKYKDIPLYCVQYNKKDKSWFCIDNNRKIG